MSYVKDKDKNQILEEMVSIAQPTSQAHEQQKAGIVVRCTEDIETAIKSFEKALSKNSEVSKNLTKKLLWLNIVLTIATLLGAVATAVIAYDTWVN